MQFETLSFLDYRAVTDALDPAVDLASTEVALVGTESGESTTTASTEALRSSGMPAWTALIPLLIPVATEAIRCIGDKRYENAEKRREMLEEDAKRMQTNLDSIRSLKNKAEKDKEEIEILHEETMKKRAEEYAEREKRQNDNIAAAMADFEKQTKEMKRASDEERMQLRKACREHIKTRQDALNKIQIEARREQEAERKVHESRQRELVDYERALHSRLLEQESHHAEVIRLLMEKHSAKVEQLQERIVEQQKEHGVVLQEMQEQRLEDEKTNSCRETALIVAHYEEIRTQSLADHIHTVRTNFSFVEKQHAHLIRDLRNAIDDPQDMHTGQVKRSMSDLESSLMQLVISEDSLLSALDKTTSVPLSRRIEIKDFVTASATHRSGYSMQARLLSGNLIRNPTVSIPVDDVKEVERLFAHLASEVKRIPLLETMDNVAKIAGNSGEVHALIGEISIGIVPITSSERHIHGVVMIEDVEERSSHSEIQL